MADVNETIRDLIISRQIDTGRHANKVVRDIMALLNDSMDDVTAKIYRKMDKGPRTKGRIDDLLAAIQKLHADTYAEAYNELKTPLLDFAQHEAAGHAEMLNRAIPVTLDILTPNMEQLKVLVSDAPIQGRLLAEWWASLESSMAVKTAQQIRLGIVGGEGAAEIVKRLAGSAKDYEPGIWSIVRRETEAVCRTAINHVSNQAAQAVFSANADLIKGVRWTSTLDARTTPICQSRDGVVFPLKEGPRPPAHVACRSFIVPITKSFREMGIDLDEIPEGKRASMSGEVPADTTYGEWLRKNPAHAKEALGATRAKLFIDGKMDVGDFVTDKGTVYTLKTLKERQSAAFAKAFN